MKTTFTHIYFYGSQDIYSNFYDVDFVDPITGFKHENSEKCFMYYKAKFFNDLEIAKEIVSTPYPWKAKELGRKVKNFNPVMWDCVKEGFMTYALYLKFSQNADLKKQLIETESKNLVEASQPDKIWGVGYYEDNPLILDESNWLGQNLLGQCLMTVRDLVK